jgi:hypothetical protein
MHRDGLTGRDANIEIEHAGQPGSQRKECRNRTEAKIPSPDDGSSRSNGIISQQSRGKQQRRRGQRQREREMHDQRVPTRHGR